MIDPLIRAVSRPDENAAIFDLALPAGHEAFAGHFPGRPVLPGVVQIDWAVRLAEAHLASERPAACDYQVKFRRIVTAEAALSLELRIDRARGVLHFTYRDDAAVVSSGRVWLDVRP